MIKIKAFLLVEKAEPGSRGLCGTNEGKHLLVQH